MTDTRSAYPTARQFLPSSHTLKALRAAASTCQGCPLFLRATQTVFGAGAGSAQMVMIGEQPGDQEDRVGEPFVGPAGKLLDEVLAAIGIDRQTVYVTNAVKHFKWVERGKRRLHAKPSAREQDACHPWLEAELEAIQPQVIVCLGATAAQALLGRTFRITQSRGRFVDTRWTRWVLATYHPSALLRAPDEATRRVMRAEFAKDLRTAAAKLQVRRSPSTRSV